MLRLNRTTEYGLIALQHLAQPRAALSSSAREIAQAHGLPFEILAKTLQRLKESGLIESAQGAKGGYSLKRSLAEVSLAEFIQAMEGPATLVACQAHAEPGEKPGCELESRCGIQGPMGRISARLELFLAGITLSEIAAPAPALALAQELTS